jgi:hypothetical protein
VVKYTFAQSVILDFRLEADENCVSEDLDASVFRVVPNDDKLQRKLIS